MRAMSLLRARIVLGGLASMGVVVSHAMAYIMAAPDEAERARLLSSTGHGLWPVTIAIAMAAWSAGLAGFIGSRISSTRTAEPCPRASYGRVARALVVLQMGGFVLLEAAERSLGGEPLHSLFAEPAVLIGIVVQFVVALLGAGLLGLLARLIDRVFRTHRCAGRTTVVPRPHSRGVSPRFAVGSGGATLRGPPTSS